VLGIVYIRSHANIYSDVLWHSLMPSSGRFTRHILE